MALPQDSLVKESLPDHLVTRLNYKLLDWSKIDNPEFDNFSLKEILNSQGKSELEFLNFSEFDLGKLQLNKLFQDYFTKDSISISRTGEKVNVPPFWATFKIKVPEGFELWRFSKILKEQYPIVIFVDPPVKVIPLDIPDDEYFGNQTSLYNFNMPQSGINIDSAWNIETGKRFVKVGVYDTGIDAGHEDLSTPYLTGKSYIFSNNAISAYDDAKYDAFGHGTKVAGIIGAKRYNGLGVSGIAGGDQNDTTGVSLVSMKVMCDGSEGDYSWNNIARAIIDGARNVGSYQDWYTLLNPPNNYDSNNWKYAEGFGLHIANHSYRIDVANLKHETPKTIGNGGGVSNGPGGPSLNDYCYLCREAYLFSLQNGMLNVASRGNHFGDESVEPLSGPSNFLPINGFHDSWFLNVGASGTDGKRLNSVVNGSSSIPHWQSPTGFGIDIIAPGSLENVVTTRSGNEMPYTSDKYSTFAGTSASAPHAAGVAALLMSKYNKICYSLLNLDPADIEYILEKSATHVAVTPGYDDSTGWGRLNAKAALDMIDFPTLQIIHPSLPPSNFQITAIDTISLHLGYPLYDNELGPLGSNFPLQLNKDYKVERYEANFTYDFSPFMSPSSELLDLWVRNSQTNTLRKMNDTSWMFVSTVSGNQPFWQPIPDTFGIEPIAEIVNLTGNTVQFKGYFYKFDKKYQYDIGSGVLNPVPLNFWYPINPYLEIPQVAYTLYIKDSLALSRYDFPCDSSNIPYDLFAGISEQNLNTMELYPNPTNDFVTLKLKNNNFGGSILVRDSRGTVVCEEKMEKWIFQKSIDMNSLSKGIYFIEFCNKNEVCLTKKIIKL
ncbi:MAG: S8/S53 family peptidase [Crocinitomicaceae bacterium]